MPRTHTAGGLAAPAHPLRAPALALLALVLALTLLPAVPAGAAISTPAAGAVVEGVVPITEAAGGSSDGFCELRNREGRSRIQVDRIGPDGALTTVFTANRDGDGGFTAQWDTVGLEIGPYRLRSFVEARTRNSGLSTSCNFRGEQLASDFVVTVQNGVDGAVTAPATAIAGEPLTATATTAVRATGAALGGQALTITATRPSAVEVEVDGEPVAAPDEVLATVEAVTGPDGAVEVPLPLDAATPGPITLTATPAGDTRFAPGASGTTAVELTPRTSAIAYTGDLRALPGRAATLAAQLTDATPGSALAGGPIAGATVELALGGQVATAVTGPDGVATATIVVAGESRTDTARATFAGDGLFDGAEDTAAVVIGDDAAEPAPEGNVEDLSASPLLGGLGRTLASALSGGSSALGEGLGALVGETPLGEPLQPLTEAIAGGLVEPLESTPLLGALDTALTTIADGAAPATDVVVDPLLQQLADGIAQAGPLGELAEATSFTWRSVLVEPDGSRTTREFPATIGLARSLDVTGDGAADLVALVTLVPSPSGAVVPQLSVDRVAGAPDDLPLSLQAIIEAPGTDQAVRVGYDTRTSTAPDAFRVDVAVADEGLSLDLRSASDAALAVTGAILPADQAAGEAADAGTAGETRFAIGFDPAPRQATLAVGDGQELGASFDTDQPTLIDIGFVDDGGGDATFAVDAVIDRVDGRFDLGVLTGEGGAVDVALGAANPIDRLAVTGRGVQGGAIAEDLALLLEQVPAQVGLAIDPAGAGALTTSAPIGVLELGFAEGGVIQRLDDPAYLNLLTTDALTSVAARLPQVAALALDSGEDTALSLSLGAPTPLRVRVGADGLQLDAAVTDAPAELSLGLMGDGAVAITGSDPIASVLITATDAAGILGDATDLSLAITDLPRALTIGTQGDLVVFDTQGDAIGLVELVATDGTTGALPVAGDGLVLRDTDTAFALGARISGLRRIAADLGEEREGVALELDTVAEQVFGVLVDDGVSPLTATIDALVPEMLIRLSESAGGTQLDYTASRATNGISFALDGITASIGDPLPAVLSICFSDGVECLPDSGVDNPSLPGIRFDAIEPTTIQFADPSNGVSVTDLRVRVLELTGSIDDEGGELYLNTTRFGEGCPEVGCVTTIDGGQIIAGDDDLRITLRPGAGFFAVDATLLLEVTEVLGIPTGLRQVGQDGIIRCVPGTQLQVRVFDLFDVGLTDALCARSISDAEADALLNPPAPDPAPVADPAPEPDPGSTPAE